LSDNVISFPTGPVGDGAVIDCDQILDENKGLLRSLTLIGEGHNGKLIVAGSHGAAESAFLMVRAHAYLVENAVDRA
jgi:hypothetical protein